MGSLYKDVLPGLVLLVASFLYFTMASHLPRSLIDTTITSSALPKLLGGGGMALSVLLIASGLAQIRQRRRPGEPWLGDWQSWLPHRRAFGVVAVVSAYALLLPHVGYGVAIALMILAMSIYQNLFYRYEFSPLRVGLGAIGGAVLFWLIFVELLGVRMPEGIWRHLL